MLDTIILKIPMNNYTITDHYMFKPSTKLMYANPSPYAKYINNPTPTDKKEGNYKPKLTITKRGRIFDLKIEFSAPKLIFGNNLDEVKETDFDEVIAILLSRMGKMGLQTDKRALKNAEVISFHASKNIPLNKGYTATLAIKELSKVNLTKRLDLNKTDFRNDGHSLSYYANSHSLIFYDKIADMRKPQKRAIDKDQTKQQSSLFNSTIEGGNRPEILRMEIRLSDKKKMNSVLKKIGFQNHPSFQNIFKKSLCQKVVNLYWDDFVKNKNLFLFIADDNPQRLLQNILLNIPKIKVKQAIYLAGLNQLCKSKAGVLGLRNIIDGYRPKTSWSRINKDLQKFQDSQFTKNQHGFVDDINKSIEEFEAYRYSKFS